MKNHHFRDGWDRRIASSRPQVCRCIAAPKDVKSRKSMRIVEVRERTAPIASPIANAFIDFSKMTL
ncbi:hypothetical protein ABTK10_21085, partial [Acinetobacter baumannii]